jgi:polyisoprenoid-binding protein YceI
MKRSSITVIFIFLTWLGHAQKYTSSRSSITFFSDAAIEDITAENKKGASIFNPSNGEIVFSIPIQEFQFEKKLMQEHFNEKYMESDKYPKAMFQGKIVEFNPELESQKARAQGKLTIHGVTRDIDVTGTIEKKDKNYIIKSTFPIKLVDYKIEIPQILWQNIAEEVEVKIEFEYKPQ